MYSLLGGLRRKTTDGYQAGVSRPLQKMFSMLTMTPPRI